MKFFDTHCDTVLKVVDGLLDFQTGEGKGHVSLPAMLSAGSCAQVFACFVLSAHYLGKERETAERMISAIGEMAAGSEGKMEVIRTGAELHTACKDGPIGALIGLEGADPLEGKAENLRHFHRLGVSDLILAWQDNPFSGTAFGTDTPLTAEGIKLVELAEELRVMIDVSHLSDSALADTFRITKRPLIASHSNCRALCPTLRNLTDGMIRELADRGGVMGINLAPAFLDPRFYEQALPRQKNLSVSEISQGDKERLRAELRAISRPSLDWVTRHLRHAIDIGGEDCVGLGGDLDGITSTPVGIEGIADYAQLPDLLLSAGFNDRQVEKVCYRNFERVFCDVLPQG
ncbi:membrane dipeptidase [Candidatus Bipolaricaulota bacterium]|nr:membrane dipeptidase [Candidatus Bipolaricaulota bacterium]